MRVSAAPSDSARWANAVVAVVSTAVRPAQRPFTRTCIGSSALSGGLSAASAKSGVVTHTYLPSAPEVTVQGWRPSASTLTSTPGTGTPSEVTVPSTA